MSAKDKIVSRIMQIRSAPYQSKFVAGDIILNKRDKIIRRIKSIVYEEATNSHAFYAMVDLANPLKNPRNMKYESMKPCKAIDSFYEKVEQHTVEILYGIKIEGADK